MLTCSAGCCCHVKIDHVQSRGDVGRVPRHGRLAPRMICLAEEGRGKAGCSVAPWVAERDKRSHRTADLFNANHSTVHQRHDHVGIGRHELLEQLYLDLRKSYIHAIVPFALQRPL